MHTKIDWTFTGPQEQFSQYAFPAATNDSYGYHCISGNWMQVCWVCPLS